MHFTYEMGAGVPLKVEKIRCAQCGANILRAYRAAQPAPLGFTVGQLDRLALLVGVLLLAVLLLRLFFVPCLFPRGEAAGRTSERVDFL